MGAGSIDGSNGKGWHAGIDDAGWVVMSGFGDASTGSRGSGISEMRLCFADADGGERGLRMASLWFDAAVQRTRGQRAVSVKQGGRTWCWRRRGAVTVVNGSELGGGVIVLDWWRHNHRRPQGSAGWLWML